MAHFCNLLYRGGGSIGIIGAMRAGLAVLADPDPKQQTVRYFGATKHNLGPGNAPTLRYQVIGRDTTIAGETRQLSVIEWLGLDARAMSELSYAQSDVSGAEKRGALAFCYKLLESLLADGQEHRATEVEAEVERADVSENTLKQCRKRWVDTGKLIIKKRGGEGKGAESAPFYSTWRLVQSVSVIQESE